MTYLTARRIHARLARFAGPLLKALRQGRRRRADHWPESASLRRVARASLTAAVFCYCCPAFAQSDAAAVPSDVVRRLTEILETIKARYARPLDDGRLVAAAVNGVLGQLDPYSTYLDAEAFRALQMDRRGEYGGLGLEVAMRGDTVTVLDVFADTPAADAGLRSGDRVVGVDGARLDGHDLQQVIEQVRGQPGTELMLTLLREGEPGERTLRLVRETIQARSVWSRLIEPGVAYVRVDQFRQRTAPTLANDLSGLLRKREGRVGGIVLDLRNNPGGQLREAVGVAAAFLPRGAPVVFTRGMAADANMQLYAEPSDYLRGVGADFLAGAPMELKTLPMVVLVNAGSASAAEIVAGALQDNGRATILGAPTFGKGSVQAVIPFGDGTGMKLTTAYYVTPAGRMIQDVGLLPDVIIEDRPAHREAALATPRPVVMERQPKARAETADEVFCGADDGPDQVTAGLDDNVMGAAPAPSGTASSADCQLEHALHLLRTTVSLTRS